MKKTSPLGISILIHYHCTPGDYDNIDSPASQSLIKEFIELGLLLKTDNTEQEKYKANREALEPYINAICSVQFPQQKWVVDKEQFSNVRSINDLGGYSPTNPLDTSNPPQGE